MRKNKVMLKSWLNNLVMGIAVVSFLAIVITIDSQWTSQYFQFVGVNAIMFVSSALILAKWGRPIEED
mgnify:CR=1 FL=1